jgi:hypothetical protein
MGNVIQMVGILGRGIERVPTKSGLVWRPTRLIETPSTNGHRSGLRTVTAHPNDGNSIIAGANANVLAGVHLFQEQERIHGPVDLIIFAAGRPPYLERLDPELTEGSVLAERFRRAVGVGKCPALEILGSNKNTYHDMLGMLQLAHRRRVKRLIVISIRLHIPRAKAFGHLILDAYKEFAATRIDYLSAEELLAMRYRDRLNFTKMFDSLIRSKAYQRTLEMEERGLRAIHSGTYNSEFQKS